MMTPALRRILLSFFTILFFFLIFLLIKPGDEPRASTSQNKGLALRTVAPLPVTLDTHYAQIDVQGKTKALDKVDLFAEVGGVMIADGFLAGKSFKKGEVLIRIADGEFKYSVIAQKSGLLSKVSTLLSELSIDYPNELAPWEDFLDDLDIHQPLPNLPEVSDSKLRRFIAAQDIYNNYYTIKSQEEKLAKYVIRAPYDGVLTSALIKKGTLVRMGQALGTYLKTDTYELEVQVSLSDLAFTTPGIEVSLSADHSDQSWQGRIARVNAVLDEDSQMARVYLTVRGRQLKEGLYLYGTLQGQAFEHSAKIDRKLIKSGGVYTIAGEMIGFKPVEVLFEDGTGAIVQGLSENDLLVADNMKDLYQGMRVNVASR